MPSTSQQHHLPTSPMLMVDNSVPSIDGHEFSTINMEDFGSCSSFSITPIPVQPSTPPVPIPAPPPPPPPPPESQSGQSTGADREPGRRKRRARGTSVETVLAALNQRKAEREAMLDEGRARRDAIIARLADQDDECARYLLHVADFMRKLPPHHLEEFKHDLQVVMYNRRLAVKHDVQAAEHEL